MSDMTRWTVEILLREDDGRTYAEAHLNGGSGVHLVGVGRAHVHPDDRDVPEIGDKLAAARALNDLGHRLLIQSTTDIQTVTHEQVRLTH